MPNTLAYLMLLIWPLVCLLMFRKLPFERALIWSLLAGYLLLPPQAAFDLPLVPAMDKTSIPTISVLLIVVFSLKRPLQLWPHFWFARIFVTGLLLSVVPTVLTNSDPILVEVLQDSGPISFEMEQRPGLPWRDVGAVLLGQMLTLLPFFLARQFLSSQRGLREILVALMVGGLAYSIPALIEIRLSPQMNVWFYGFFQHSFFQMMRGDGFRPIVFLPHGLWLALFICTSLLAAAALLRTSEPGRQWRVGLAIAYLGLLLYLCKSLAALAYGLVLTPVILFASARWQIRVAFFFALVAVSYPILRNMGMVPLDAIVEQAEAISADRSRSLDFRFEHEELLLERAAEKPLFGWGGWGRNLVYDDEDGTVLSVPDGRWIIVFGISGWLGYISEFGLLALPLMLVFFRQMGRDPMLPTRHVSALALILGITLIDMLLNATLTTMTWVTAGALLGYVERHQKLVHRLHPNLLSGGKLLSPVKRRMGGRTVL